MFGSLPLAALATARALSRLSQLRVLDIAQCAALPPELLLHAAAAPHLRELALEGVPHAVSARGVAVLVRCAVIGLRGPLGKC